MQKKYKKIFKSLHLCLMIVSALMLWGCIADSPRGGNIETSEIDFRASVKTTENVRTRELRTDYISENLYPVDFFIQMNWNDQSKIGTFRVPTGYEGKLSDTDENPMNWQDLRSEHVFYGWTIPWIDKWNPENDFKDNETYIPLEFKNSSERDGYEDYSNNKELEKFIGTKAGPFSYVEHGKYVDLTFHHLVSKIKIGEFSLVQTDGSVKKDLKGDITFIKMPTTARFYPHPTGDILNKPYCRDGRPVVVPGEPDVNNGITYFIDNQAVGTDIFYICPESDFSQIEFKVNLNNAEYKDYSTYYGTFETVQFVREAGSDYDLGNGVDDKVLHAGEMMTLNIVLIPGIGPGIKLIISDWSDEKPRESQYHTYPGIYSDQEMTDLLNVFANQKDYNNPPEDVKRLWEMYGEEGPDGEKYFPLFDNVTLDSNILPIPDGYVLDGKGHTIFMKTNRGSNNDFGSAQTYYNIGPCKDVYLSDPNGNNTIYIDPNGQVCLFDEETGQYNPSGHYLQTLDAPEKSYDISAETGVVHKSTYYNNNITGS